MSLHKKGITLFLLLILSATALKAQSYDGQGYLTADQIERLKKVKEDLQGVDTQSMQESIRAIEKSRHPLMDLEMKEAMAKAFIEITQNFNIQTQHQKTWLYSMICLNMAYLQFGGDEGKYGSTTELNRLIRKTLIKYLPAEVLKESGSIYNLQ